MATLCLKIAAFWEITPEKYYIFHYFWWSQSQIYLKRPQKTLKIEKKFQSAANSQNEDSNFLILAICPGGTQLVKLPITVDRVGLDWAACLVKILPEIWYEVCDSIKTMDQFLIILCAILENLRSQLPKGAEEVMQQAYDVDINIFSNRFLILVCLAQGQWMSRKF